jgi:hypothetical protein
VSPWWFFAGGPALFGEPVVAAPQREIVDVGGVAFRPRGDVVDFGEVARHVAVGERTAAVLGMNVEVMHT